MISSFLSCLDNSGTCFFIGGVSGVEVVAKEYFPVAVIGLTQMTRNPRPYLVRSFHSTGLRHGLGIWCVAVDAQENSGNRKENQQCHQGVKKLQPSTLGSKRALESAAGEPSCPQVHGTSTRSTPPAAGSPVKKGDKVGTGSQDSPMRLPRVSCHHKV